MTADKTLSVQGALRGFRVAAEASARLLDSPRRLRVELVGARLGASALPTSLWRRFSSYTLSLEPSPETPFVTEIQGLTLKDGISIP